MDKAGVIEYVANNKILHNLIQNIGGNKDDDLQDLEQDIYIDLYTKPEETLVKLYENKQLAFYLARIVLNNIHSSTSRFYTTYKKPLLNKVELTPEEDDNEG